MEFITKVTQRLRQVQIFRRLLKKEDGLINTTDLLVATGATVILAAGIAGAGLSALDEANYGKAQPDAQTIAGAINNFYKDTGRWPGQAEHAALSNTATVFLATGTKSSVSGTVTTTTGSVLPDVAGAGLQYAAQAACTNNSGQGFVFKGVGGYNTATTVTAAIVSLGTPTILDLNDFLVRKPSATSYPNWAGPYVQEISGDPWDRAWVAYLAPLYCSEDPGTTSGGGSLGYAWLWTGGTNRTITSAATDPDLDDNGDDAGVNLGKLTPGQAVTQ